MSTYPRVHPPTLSIPENYERVRGNFWRPSKAFVHELSEYLAGREVLEIFAGNGYLARALHSKGIQITATSILSGHDNHEAGFYFPVMEVDAVTAVSQLSGGKDVLLVSWPTVTDQMLKAAIAWGSDRDIIFIGETTDYSKNQLGGCATDEFFEVVREVHRFETYQGNHYESAVVYRLT